MFKSTEHSVTDFVNFDSSRNVFSNTKPVFKTCSIDSTCENNILVCVEKDLGQYSLYELWF